MMFRLNADGRENGWPLLNIVHASGTKNPYAESGHEQKYAVVTVHGDSEFAVLTELERQYPEYRHITILETEFR